MSRTLTAVAAFFGVLGAIGMFLMLVGMTIPEKHVEVVTIDLVQDRASVWGVLTDFPAMPTWWPKLRSVEREMRTDGTEVWWHTEVRGRRVGFLNSEVKAPSRLVRKIANEESAFGGSWTFELAEQAGKTQLTLTEESYIRGPVFRTLYKYVIGYRSGIDDFLEHLGKKLASGVAVTPKAS